MRSISNLRCFNHGNREAVALCPQCSRTFCRECIIDHEARAICARCLAVLQVNPVKRGGVLPKIVGGTGCLLSYLFLWAVFYYLGKILLTIPSSFHESALWRLF